MIMPDVNERIMRSLIHHEDKTNFPYFDTKNKITIGIGYNLSDRGLDDQWIYSQCQQDINFFYSQLSTFPWFHDLNDDRKIVLVDMCFMGWKKFLEFKKLIAALEQHDYVTAANEMLNSEWSKEVKTRAIDLSQGMLTGVYHI